MLARESTRLLNLPIQVTGYDTEKGLQKKETRERRPRRTKKKKGEYKKIKTYGNTYTKSFKLSKRSTGNPYKNGYETQGLRVFCEKRR